MRAQGIDISKHQAGYDASIKKHDFVFIRATNGIFVDKKFAQHAESIAGIPVRGAYHYFSSYKAKSDKMFWQRQADHYLNVMNNYDFNLYVLDFEREIGIVGNNAVDPDYRGRGIGSQLHKKVLEEFKRNGMKIALVSTLDIDIPAQNMYKKHGFAELVKTIHYSQKL